MPPMIIYRIYRNGYRIPGEYSNRHQCIREAQSLTSTVAISDLKALGAYEAFECNLTTGERKLVT